MTTNTLSPAEVLDSWPYLRFIDDPRPLPWQPTQEPACGHGPGWWRAGRCDQCGCSDLRPITNPIENGERA